MYTKFNTLIINKYLILRIFRPAKEDLYAEFTYTSEELNEIKKKASENNEFEIIKKTKLTNKDKSIVYCEVRKTVYIANKKFFKNKRKKLINR